MKVWPFIENIALYILIGFLCWLWDSGWPILLLIVANTLTSITAKNRKANDD